MRRRAVFPRNAVRRLWRIDAPLTAVGVGMLAVLAATLAGLWLDPRTIGGAPAWLKPAKFAASIGLYTLTLAWVFGYLPEWKRTRRVAGWTTAVVLVVEIVIIAAQAWRGTTSHFNTATTLDRALFSIMGASIVLQTLITITVAVALWRQPMADRALGWALRFGIVIALAGASSGGLMTLPTAAQLEQARASRRADVVGAHTVGAADGGPGLPGTGWSREHGDLRVPHFLGLHALQALPLVALLVGRRRAEPARTRLVFAAAASYVSLFMLLLWQALRGQSILQPDALTLAVLGTWAVASVAAAWYATGARPAHAATIVAVC